MEETQIASINDEDDPFRLLEENVNELESRGLVDGDLTVGDYVNIDFEVCTSETSSITDREILDSILINDYAEEEEETEEESNDLPPEKPKLSEIAHAIELLECWSLFDNRGGEIRQPLPLDGTHLDAVSGFIPTKRFHPSASTKRAQLSVATTTVRSTDLFNIMSSP